MMTLPKSRYLKLNSRSPASTSLPNSSSTTAPSRPNGNGNGVHPSRHENSGPWWKKSIGSDPYQVTKWKVIAEPNPGYLPKTPMREGANGSKACGSEFESKGLAYCPTCLKLPAEERNAIKPAFIGRMCQGPGCENPIPRKARADRQFCSAACQLRAARSRRKPRENDGDNP